MASSSTATAATSSSSSSSKSSSSPPFISTELSKTIDKVSELPPLSPTGMKYRELRIRVDELGEENRKMSASLQKLTRLFEEYKRQAARDNYILRQQIMGDPRYPSIRTTLVVRS